jgi:uncharacterized repeat protein (TIGR03803 family)
MLHLDGVHDPSQTDCHAGGDMRQSKEMRPVRQRAVLASIIVVLGTICAAQTVRVTTLHNFTGLSSSPADGANPASPLVQGLDGRFYGTTLAGGNSSYQPDCDTYFNGCGTFFRIDTSGNLSILYSFCNATCSDGIQPYWVVAGPGGNFFGTTNSTAFKITPQGSESTFYTFNPGGFQGSIPILPIWITLGWDGAFHGSGANPVGGTTCGTVFRLTPAGKISITPGFCQQPGYSPQALIQATDGNLYGVDQNGGNPYIDQSAGTVFKIGSSAVETLYEFCSQLNCVDGALPKGLVEGNDGNFYGTTQKGGANGWGTFFRITPSGALTTLYNFCSMENCIDGGSPLQIILASDGNFYGSTQLGETFFKITPAGSFTFFYTNGVGPAGLLVQGTDGAFYGTAQGGINGGVVFRVDVGLAPFIRPLVPFGAVATEVAVLGTNLKGATAVNFNGTPATFRIASATALWATVPQGATSGPITVTLPTASLTSNGNFTVLP